MYAGIGLLRRPAQDLRVQIRVVEALASVEEVLANVSNRALDLAFGAGAIGATCANAKIPVCRKAQELGVLEEFAADLSLIVDDHGLHLIEEQLGGHTTERSKRLF